MKLFGHSLHTSEYDIGTGFNIYQYIIIELVFIDKSYYHIIY